MRGPTFLDTGGIYAMADDRDADHAAVSAVYLHLRRTFILHDLILVEAFSLLTKRLRKQVALQFIGELRSSPRLVNVQLTADLLDAGWARCQRFADKEWDWVDCVSFELMERRGIREALSLDRHFTQAGFTLVV